MTTVEATTAWWRPESTRQQTVARAADASGNSVAFWALMAFTACLLLSPQLWFPILKMLRLAFLSASLAILAYILDRHVLRRQTAPFNMETGIAFVLVSWAIVTIPFSYWPSGSIDVLRDHYLKAVVFFWLIAGLVTTLDRLRTFAWILSLCSIPMAVVGVLHFQTGEMATSANAVVQRIEGYGGSGIAGNPNDLALMLNILIPITGALILITRRTIVRVALAGVVLVSIAAVIVTFSRAGFITLIAIFLLALLAFARHRWPGTAATILVLAVAVVPPLLPDGYTDRIDTITDISADRTGSAQGRWADFQVAAELSADHPVVGVGLGQDILGLNDERGRSTWRSVHNAYLEYLVDLGVPGLVLFLWFLWATFRHTRRVQVRAAGDPALYDLLVLAEAVQMSFIACAVAAFFHPMAYQFYFFCLAGLAVALKNACRTETAITHVTPTGA